MRYEKSIMVFLGGMCTALIMMFIIYPFYSDYRKETEIYYMLSIFKQKIKNTEKIESKHFVEYADKFKIMISKENWVYLQSHRSHQTLLLIPIKRQDKVEWECYTSSIKLNICL